MLEYLGKKEKGFTLMELLIAVAIVVILAGVGIPIYLRFQAGAKHAEASTNLNGIKLSEEGYKLANGTYIDCTTSPRAAPNQDAEPWVDLGVAPADGFTQIGFATSADVRFIYGVNNSDTTSFVAEALGDTNGDGTNILFVANQVTGPHLIGTHANDGVDFVDANLTLGDNTMTSD
jgi:prepilin-type N-terminal cleavage/methylation domain-containing protein